LHLDEAELTSAGDAALDVVAEFLELAVGRLEAKVAFDRHEDGTRQRGAGLGADGATVFPVMAASKPKSTTSRPPSTAGGRGEIWASSFKSSNRFCSRP